MNEIRHPNDYDRRRSAVAEPVSSLVIWDGIAGFLKRRRRTILATALAVLVLGLAALLFVPWNYKATAIVAINAQPAIAENSQNHVQLTPAERMQREIQGLQSRALAAQVIEKLKLDREPEFNPDLRGPGLIERALASVSIMAPVFTRGEGPDTAEAAELRRSATVDLFMQKLTITPVLTADLVQVTFASRDPRIAYRVANALVDTYIETAAQSRGNTLQKAADALQDRITAVRDELRDLPGGTGALNTIERQLEARRTLLQAYIAKLGELLLLKAAIEPRVVIQSRAVYPINRAGVPLALGFPFVVVAGLMLGVGLGVVQEARQRTLGTSAQLEAAFGLDLLGGTGLAHDGAEPIDSALPADPKRLAKAYDRIALEILMSVPKASGAVVAFTGASQNQAKSAIAVGVARALARAERRTLIVDANLAPSTYQGRLASASKPLAASPEAAAEHSAYSMRREEATGLVSMAAALDRESGAAAYERAAKAIGVLAGNYDFVVLDLPPVAGNPEARFLARDAKLAILVVRREQDRADALRRVVDRLNADGVRVLGAVLTKGRFERNMFDWVADLLRRRA